MATVAERPPSTLRRPTCPVGFEERDVEEAMVTVSTSPTQGPDRAEWVRPYVTYGRSNEEALIKEISEISSKKAQLSIQRLRDAADGSHMERANDVEITLFEAFLAETDEGASSLLAELLGIPNMHEMNEIENWDGVDRRDSSAA